MKTNRFSSLSVLMLLLPMAALAQSIPSPALAAAPAEPRATVTLSPFEVSEDKDQGYAASHSLAGGRINTELIKTPADVTVLTKEFLRDMGAVDYQDAIPYMTSAVPVPVATTDHGTTIQLRGMPAGNQTRNFFQLARAIDMYVVERLESMRGPNSLLFGAGSVGGVVNTMTKRALTGRQSGEATVRWDSEGSRYGAIDVNRPLGRDTAVRVNVFRQENRYWIPRKFDDRSGMHLAALHRPWAKGELRFEGEYGRSSTNYPPQFARDNNSNYTTGSRVTAPLTVAAPAPGLSRITTDTLVFNPAFGSSPINLLNFGRTSGASIAMSPEVHELNPNIPIVPRNYSIQPRNGTGDIRHFLFGGYLEQQWSKRLVSEFAVQYAHIYRNAKNTKWDGYFIDPNAVLPNGAPNPKVGLPYDERAWTWYDQDHGHFDVRAALAYDMGLSRWSQRFNLMVFHREQVTDFQTYAIGRSNNPVNPLINATVNVPLFRIYWNDPQPIIAIPANDNVYSWSRLTTTDQRVKNTFDSIQLATISSIWDDRLNIVAGIRTDDWRQKQRDGDGKDAAGRFTTTKWQQLSGVPTTSSGGFVFFPIRAVGLYVNYAETFNQATGGGNGLFGESFGPTTAFSSSGGLRFRLAGDRIVGSVGYYEVTEAGRLIQYQNGPINRTWVSLGKSELQINPETTTYRDSVDYTGSGVELDLTMNLGKNLRLRGNIAKPKTQQQNTVPGLRAYYAKYIDQWRAAAADPTNPNRTQINTDINALNTVLSNANEGRVLNNTPDYTGSVFGMYTFTSTFLRRLRLGGGVAWQGPRVIGNEVNRSYDYIKSKSYTLANLSAGYSLKLFDRNFDLQLNVSNLLNSDDPIYNGTTAIGTTTYRASLYYPDARKTQLMGTYRF